jgi:hypothetical protein
LEAVYAFFSVSTIWHKKFVDVQKTEGLSVLKIPQQSDTRWVFKYKDVTILKLWFVKICVTLEYFVNIGKPRERAEVKGFLL